MSLSDWARNGWLRPHVPTRSEIDELFEVARRDLHDARSKGLSDDWRFAIAYNAALQLARAAQLASGYDTPKGEASHFRAIHSLSLTLGLSDERVREFDGYRKKRASSVYEVAGRISASDVREMLALAEELETRVPGWMRQTHPELAT